MRKTFFGGAVALFLLMFGATQAVYAVTIELLGVGDSQVRSGAYAGLYDLQINGTETIEGMCNDFDTSISIGHTWEAGVYTYTDIQNGAPVKFAADGIEKYSQAGWLFSQLSTATLSQQADINVAIWKIFSSSTITMNTVATAYYNDATSGLHDNFNFDGIMAVLTPNPLSASQENLINAVPVPAAAWLFSSGLIGLVGVARRRK